MKFITFTFLTLVSFLASFTYAQWSTDPANPGLVCDLTGHQNNVKALPAGEGGVFVFWLDTRNNPGYTPREIYGQHYDGDGYPMWETNGRLIMSHYNGIMDYDVKINDFGNIMIGTITKSANAGAGDSLQFQMLDYAGESEWEEPLVVADAGADPNYILYLTSFILLPVGTEFYAILGVSYYGGANGNRFTRFNMNGDLLGAYDGVPVGNQLYIGRSECAASNDGTGDFFLFHANGNGSGAGLSCYRFDNSGNTLWGPVNVVENTSGLSYQYHGEADDNGITFVWQGTSDGSVNLFARRLTLSGSFAWGGNTVSVCTAGGSQDNFHLKRKDSYLYVAWADGRPGVDPGYFDIYAQKMDTTGYLFWQPDGIEIASFNTYSPYPMLEILDDYSIIVDHQSTVAGLMAQKVEPDGSLPWAPDAYQVSTANFNPFYQMHMIFQSDGNTVVVWNKAASGGGSDGVYITRVDPDFPSALPEKGIGSVQIYPNPATNFAAVQLPGWSGKTEVSLFDATGRLIEIKSIHEANEGDAVQFDTAGLPSGIYLVNVTNGTENQQQKLVVLK